MSYLWLAFALVSAACFGFYHVINRSIMKHASSYAYALLINGIGFLFSLLLISSHIEFPTTLAAWLFVLAASGMWVIGMLVANLSYKHTIVSRREPISQLETVFVFLLGILLLGESFSWLKLVGTVLIISGFLLLTTRSQKAITGLRSKGVIYTIITAALFAIATIIDKAALSYVPADAYAVLLYCIPALMLLVFIKGRTAETWHLLKKKWLVVSAAAALSVTGYYFSLRAYELVDATLAYPILKLSSIFAVVGGLLFFREEREHISRKLAATALVFIGAMLVAGYTALPY